MSSYVFNGFPFISSQTLSFPLNTLNPHIISYQEQGLGGDLVTNDGVFDHLFDQLPNLPHPLTQGNGRCIKVTPEVNSNSITNPTNFTTPISVKT